VYPFLSIYTFFFVPVGFFGLDIFISFERTTLAYPLVALGHAIRVDPSSADVDHWFFRALFGVFEGRGGVYRIWEGGALDTLMEMKWIIQREEFAINLNV
jgi:hypothetical protein